MLNLTEAVAVLIEPSGCSPEHSNDEKVRALAVLLNNLAGTNDAGKRKDLVDCILSDAQTRTEAFSESLDRLRLAA